MRDGIVDACNQGGSRVVSRDDDEASVAQRRHVGMGKDVGAGGAKNSARSRRLRGRGIVQPKNDILPAGDCSWICAVDDRGEISRGCDPRLSFEAVLNSQGERGVNKPGGGGIEKREVEVVIGRAAGVIEFPNNDAGPIRKRRDGRVVDRTHVRLVPGFGSAIDDKWSADPGRVVVAANNDAVVCGGGVGIGDKKSAIWRRGDCGMDRHVDGSINADDAIQEPARHRRTDRISARVEEMRQQIDIAAGLRIFVDDDEVAVSKGGNGGIGLRSGQPIGVAFTLKLTCFSPSPLSPVPIAPPDSKLDALAPNYDDARAQSLP